MVYDVFPQQHGGEGEFAFGFPGEVEVAVAVHVSYREGGKTAEGAVPGHLGNQGDAQTGIDEFVDGVGVVAFHHHFGGEACFLAEGFQNVPEDESLGRGDVVLMGEVFQVHIGEAGVTVGEGKDHDQVFPKKGDCMVVINVMDAGVEGEIRMSGGGLHFGVDDFQYGFGMGFPEFRQEGGDEFGGRKDGKVYLELLQVPGVFQFLLHGLVFPEEIFRVFQKDMAVPGEADVSSFLFEEGDIQLLFQSADGAGQGGLGDMEGFRSFGKMFHFCRFQEIFQGSEI